MADLIDNGWQEYTAAGTTNVAPPSGAVSADAVCLGGGGGGNGFVRGSNPLGLIPGSFPVDGPVQVTVGAGGALKNAGGDSVCGTVTGRGGPAGGAENTPGGTKLDAFGRSFRQGNYGKPGEANGAGGSGIVWLRFWVSPKTENLHVGGRPVQDVRLGGTPVKSVYAGSTLIYGEES